MKLIGKRLISDFIDSLAIDVFCKSLYLYFTCKTLLNWPVIIKLVGYKPVQVSSLLGKIIFAPALLLSYNPEMVLGLFVLVHLASIFLRHNYVSAIIIFWIMAGLYRLTIPIVNGSDLILLLLLFFNIFLARYPNSSIGTLRVVQVGIHNCALLLCRLQLCFIYLLSGLDKIQSDMWRSGEAIQAILHIDYLMNPAVNIQLSDPFAMAVGWAVILFELLFLFLVWIRKARIWVLAAGVVFHLMIAFFLSLPDFGLMMIIAYLIFLEDADYRWIMSRFRRSAP